ncbi:MAG TPA: hypothetical protein VJ385_02465 [Fibrobacteria bacterium]|nr:hypothetical protein [Fibrobacteria bacterium]
MKTLPALALIACLGFTGCYTQFYTQGYAARAVDEPREYARSPRAQGDTALPDDSAAQAAGPDGANRPGTVIVNNNYYRQSPYYRGYLVDQWEYPYVSFGFYSSRYRDYYGAYWWNDPWYRDGYYRRGGHGRDYHGSHPSGGGGSPGPYQSDKRIFSIAPDRSPKGRRSEPAPAAPKYSSESGSDSGSTASGSRDQDDHPKVNKGRRR